jgi:ligand-binding sensor domain-containing protein/signal transduction histidine kinase
LLGAALLVCLLMAGGLLAACTPQPAGNTGLAQPPALDSAPVAPPATDPDTRARYTAPPVNIRFAHLNTAEGLSHSVIHAILQDSQGFMWFGTEDGLNRFDGYNFLVFRPDPDDFYSINDIWINTLFEDSHGILWIGTRQGGLNRYDPGTGHFTHYLNDPLVQNSLSSNTVHAIQEDNNGYLWIGSDLGLDRLDPVTGTFKHFYISPAGIDAPLDDQINVILKASSGILWVGTSDNGLKRVHPTTGSYKIYTHDPDNSTSLSDNHINAILEDRNGTLWVATEDGLNLFDWETGLFFRYRHSASPLSISSNTVYSLNLDRSGNLWVGTNTGLDFLVRQTRAFQHYRQDTSSLTSLSNETVLTIFEDQGGILWVGTYGGGLNTYDPVQDMFEYYYHSDTPGSLSGNIIFPIHAAPDGAIWIGTYGEGLNRLDPVTGMFSAYTSDPDDPLSLQSDNIWSLLVDHAGTLWVGTSSGLDRMDAGTGVFQHYQNIPGDAGSLSRGAVQALYEDSRGSLWVGTQFGLNRFEPGTGSFTHFIHISGDPASLSHNDITAILEDDSGRLWVGTSRGGLNRMNTRTLQFSAYLHDPQDRISIGNNSILSIYQARDGTIWIGTAGGGLSRYDEQTDSFDTFTTADGLPNNVVYGILEDESGCLWLSTNFGLSFYDPAALAFRNFTASDGLQANQFNTNAYARAPSGDMYFGGVGGLTVFTPGEITASDYVPPIVLLSFMQDGEPLDTDVPIDQLQTITIRYPRNYFEFEYTALSYSRSGQSQYAYFLENFDEQWFFAGTERNGRYTNLPGGEYILRVKASNSDGLWNEEGIAVQINVVPPFWQTTLFRAVVLLALGGLAALLYQARVRSVQARAHELERLVRSRTLALEKRGQELEALYSADGRMLRTQTLEQVYQALVDVAEEMLRADKSAVLTWDAKQTRLAVRVSRGFNPGTIQKMRFKRGEGIIGRVAETGQPVIVTDLASDPIFNEMSADMRATIMSEGISSFLHLPILIEQRVVGVFTVGFTHSEAFNEDTVRLFSSLVQRAALSVENALLFEQTKDLAILEERNRLARDLHDSAKQKAFAALAQLGAASGLLKGRRQGIRTHLDEAEDLVYEVIQELTFLIQEIHPAAMNEKGLASMLREYVFQWESRNDAELSLKIENERRLPLNVEQAFYRIIQEALANITRHSSASLVTISLNYQEGEIQAEVADNGKGFDCGHKPAGLGLRSIRERIESIHGRCDIISAPGKGTRLLVSAPLEITEKE